MKESEEQELEQEFDVCGQTYCNGYLIDESHPGLTDGSPAGSVNWVTVTMKDFYELPPTGIVFGCFPSPELKLTQQDFDAFKRV